MKESAWRSKLIAMRRKTNPTDFIWAMDAKFKAGFPDLYILARGIPHHIELKIGKFYQHNAGLDPIQNHTLRQLSIAGAKCYCLNLQNDGTVGVTEVLQYQHYSRVLYTKDFYSNWIKEIPLE